MVLVFVLSDEQGVTRHRGIVRGLLEGHEARIETPVSRALALFNRLRGELSSRRSEQS